MIEKLCLKSVQVVNVRIRRKSSYSVRVSIVCFIAHFASLNLSSLCDCIIKKTKELLMVYRTKYKNSAYDQVFKFQEASKSTFMSCCSNFYAVPLFFIFEI